MNLLKFQNPFLIVNVQLCKNLRKKSINEGNI